MTRPKYTITEADHHTAVAYLKAKLLDPAWPSDDTTAQVAASRTFKKASRDRLTLTTWCDKHLDADQMTRLKGVIRQARKRVADLARDKPKSVNLSHRAWLILHDLSKAEGTTLSQVIESRLTKEWAKL